MSYDFRICPYSRIPLRAWSDLKSFVSPEENIRNDGGARCVPCEVAVCTVLPTTNLVWSDRWIAVFNPSQSIASAGYSEVSKRARRVFNHILLMLDYILGLSMARYSTFYYDNIINHKSLHPQLSQSSFWHKFFLHVTHEDKKGFCILSSILSWLKLESEHVRGKASYGWSYSGSREKFPVIRCEVVPVQNWASSWIGVPETNSWASRTSDLDHSLLVRLVAIRKPEVHVTARYPPGPRWNK